MKAKFGSAVFIAAAAGALIAAPLAGSATAAVPGAQLPIHQDAGWGGFNRPGWVDPADPWHDDWHCDRHGFWHNDEHDQWGHRDGRCHVW